MIIRCEFCRSDLHPLLLKQAIKTINGMLYDIECINPECRKHNWISEAFYLSLRDDHFKPYVPSLNNKFPSEMNVIFCSMNRMGISWLIRSLSQFHEGMFGVPIQFISKVNTEISHVRATRDRLPLPQGWNNIYDVDVRALLKKNYKGQQYDRVILIQRDLVDVMKASLVYWSAQGLDSNQIEKLFDKIPINYEKYYGFDDPDDPRFLRVTLEDLNNYTKVSFTKLMDFLNFPIFGRPPIIPTPVKRNWEVFSSVLEKDEKLGSLLQRVKALENEIQVDVGIELKESTLQNILVMGPRILKGCHFSENIYYAFKELNYNVEFIGVEELGKNEPYRLEYKKHTKLYHLSNVVKKCKTKPDLIVIDEPAWYFKHDTNLPVFYVQREFKRPPTVFYPNIAFFWHRRILEYFKDIFAPYWFDKVQQSKVIGIAVDPKRFELKDKTIKGIVDLAGREKLMVCLQMNELTARGILYNTIEYVKKVRNLGIRHIEDLGGNLTDERFREILPQCEAIWVHIPLGQYISRRMLEAMVCKTVCVMKLENEEHEIILHEMGFIANEHYIKINELEDIVKLNKKFKYKNYRDMVNKAYDVVMARHLYIHKAQELIECYQSWALQSKGVIIK